MNSLAHWGEGEVSTFRLQVFTLFSQISCYWNCDYKKKLLKKNKIRHLFHYTIPWVKFTMFVEIGRAPLWRYCNVRLSIRVLSDRIVLQSKVLSFENQLSVCQVYPSCFYKVSNLFYFMFWVQMLGWRTNTVYSMSLCSKDPVKKKKKKSKTKTFIYQLRGKESI